MVSYVVGDFRTRYLLEWYLIDWDLLVWDLKVRDLLSCNRIFNQMFEKRSFFFKSFFLLGPLPQIYEIQRVDLESCIVLLRPKC